MAFYGKEFKIEKTENIEEFVGSLGIPEDRKQKLLKLRAPKKIDKNADGTYTLSATPAPMVFKSGVQFDHAYSSVTAKVTITVDGNTVSQVQQIGDTIINSKMEYTGNELVETVTSNKWSGIAKIYYKA